MRYTKQAALDIARRISLEAQRDELRVQLEVMTRERDEARAAMHRREAEVVSARNERDGLASRLDAVTDNAYDLVRERNRAHNDLCLARESEARMRAALRKYGRHESMCDVGNTCDCGLDRILGS